MTGWKDVHIGFEDDGFKINGLEVWKQVWRPVAGERIEPRHPAHRNEVHPFWVYEIGALNSPVRFSSTELSPGAYGFHVPA